jgi:hypothetical protein
MLENAVAELRQENAKLRTHLLTELKNTLTDTTGRDGARGEVGPRGERGEVGAKGDKGDRGEKGERGDYTLPTESEVGAELLAIRKKHARVLAKVLDEQAANRQRQSSGLKSALAAVLKNIEGALR